MRKNIQITIIITIVICLLAPFSTEAETTKVSYQRDLKKNYTYRYFGDNNNWEKLTYKGPFKGKDKKKAGYNVWQTNNSNGYIGEILEKQTKEGLYSSDIYNTDNLLIDYPLKLGKSWIANGGKWTIKALNKTISVPAGTFKDVVEIKGVYEEVTFNNYYANGVGLIRGDSDGEIMLELTTLKKKSTEEPKTAIVDVSNGSSLSVRNGAGTNYKKIGSLKNKAKVTVYSQTKSGWSQITYNKKKAYISNDYLRFYTKLTATDGKKIVDRVNKIESETVGGIFTKKQLYSGMSLGYTTSFIDSYFKSDIIEYSKNTQGDKTYIYKASDFNYYTMYYLWEKNAYSKLPSISHYSKNEKEYMVVSQFWYRNEIRPAYTGKLYLYKKNSKSNWKVYKFNRVF